MKRINECLKSSPNQIIGKININSYFNVDQKNTFYDFDLPMDNFCGIKYVAKYSPEKWNHSKTTLLESAYNTISQQIVPRYKLLY